MPQGSPSGKLMPGHVQSGGRELSYSFARDAGLIVSNVSRYAQPTAACADMIAA